MKTVMTVLALAALSVVSHHPGWAQNQSSVQIDILPRDKTNSVRIASNDKIDVAILSSPTFKAPDDVDYRSVLFAGSGPFLSAIGTNTAVLSPYCVENDVNDDTLFDLVCRFETDKLKLKQGRQRVELTGRLNDGTNIAGEDTIDVIAD